MFEKKFDAFLKEQQRGATGQRLEMLHRDLTGTKKLLEAVLLPVLNSFEGLILEHEMVSLTGVRIYGDVLYGGLNTIFEADGYVAHAENITRDRFSFEKMRVRTMMMEGYRYVPFSWDELDKKADTARRAVYELLGRYGGAAERANKLTLMEREVILSARRMSRPLKLGDVCNILQLGPEASRRLLRSLTDKKLVHPLKADKQRCHAYVLDDAATSYLY